MLERARDKAVYDVLRVADISATGFPTAAYNLVATVLVDEHLPSLMPLYQEAARLLDPSGLHVLVGYHPSFMMTTGMPTHFRRPNGERIAIETHVHLLSDHVRCAHSAGFVLTEMRERVIDDRWIELKPKWKAYRGIPFSFALVWANGSTTEVGRSESDETELGRS
jgi:SAM-dependent methyltransferase